MRYNVVTRNLKTGDVEIHDFNHGCWGRAGKNSICSDEEVIELHYFMSPEEIYGSSLADFFVNKDGMSFTDFCSKLAEEAFGKNLNYKITVLNKDTEMLKLSVIIDPEMPRNYTMNYLFGYRMAFTAPTSIVGYLKARGVKSLRKLFIMCQLFTFARPVFADPKEVYEGIPSCISLRTSGGTNFHCNFVEPEDLVRAYRRKPMIGPADSPWKEGGGYRTGDNYRTVQFSTSLHAKKRFDDLAEKRKARDLPSPVASEIPMEFFYGVAGKPPYWLCSQFGVLQSGSQHDSIINERSINAIVNWTKKVLK